MYELHVYHRNFPCLDLQLRSAENNFFGWRCGNHKIRNEIFFPQTMCGNLDNTTIFFKINQNKFKDTNYLCNSLFYKKYDCRLVFLFSIHTHAFCRISG